MFFTSWNYPHRFSQGSRSSLPSISPHLSDWLNVKMEHTPFLTLAGISSGNVRAFLSCRLSPPGYHMDLFSSILLQGQKRQIPRPFWRTMCHFFSPSKPLFHIFFCNLVAASTLRATLRSEPLERHASHPSFRQVPFSPFLTLPLCSPPLAYRCYTKGLFFFQRGSAGF